MGSGKDTVCSMIQYQLSSFNGKSFKGWSNERMRRMAIIDSKWENKKFAYKLKLITSILTGIPTNKFEDSEFKNSLLGTEWGITAREFLQRLGTDAIRDWLHKETWVNALWSDYNDSCKWIITDTRFKNEIESVKKMKGISLRLTKNSNKQANHKSETSLDSYNFDYIIDNDYDSLAETYIKVEEFLSEHF